LLLNANPSFADLARAFSLYDAYHVVALDLCVTSWTTFNLTWMIYGIALFALICFCSVGYFLLSMNTGAKVNGLEVKSLHSELTPMNVVAIFLLVLRIVGLTSNSFIEAEQSMFQFLLFSMLAMYLFYCLRTNSHYSSVSIDSYFNFIGLIFCLKLSQFIRTGLKTSGFESSGSSVWATLSYGVCFVFVVLMPPIYAIISSLGLDEQYVIYLISFVYYCLLVIHLFLIPSNLILLENSQPYLDLTRCHLCYPLHSSPTGRASSQLSRIWHGINEEAFWRTRFLALSC
jgi:hypothetical protein